MGKERNIENSDISDGQCMFVSHSEDNQKFNIECTFIDVLQIRQNIPSRWRDAIYIVNKCMIDTNVTYLNTGKIQ